MELTDYPLRHEADLMPTLLKMPSQGPPTMGDAVERTKRNPRAAGLPSRPARGRRWPTHPGGIDDSVLMGYPEFRALVEERAGHSMRTVGDKDALGDVPRVIQFDQGCAAFNDGMDINDNPYSRDTPMHIAWENGWSEAKDDAVRTDGWANRSTNPWASTGSSAKPVEYHDDRPRRSRRAAFRSSGNGTKNGQTGRFLMLARAVMTPRISAKPRRRPMAG